MTSYRGKFEHVAHLVRGRGIPRKERRIQNELKPVFLLGNVKKYLLSLSKSHYPGSPVAFSSKVFGAILLSTDEGTSGLYNACGRLFLFMGIFFFFPLSRCSLKHKKYAILRDIL